MSKKGIKKPFDSIKEPKSRVLIMYTLSKYVYIFRYGEVYARRLGNIYVEKCKLVQ